MKQYQITVNGTTYHVEVEEVDAGSQESSAQTAQKTLTNPIQSNSVTPSKTSQNGTGVVAPMPGKILEIKKTVGTTVKKGEILFILEAMKMENEIVAPIDGTLTSISVSQNESVEAGKELALLEA